MPLMYPRRPVAIELVTQSPPGSAGRFHRGCLLLCLLIAVALGRLAAAADLPDAAQIKPVKLFECDQFSEGVCFDYEGNGFISDGPLIIQFQPDGSHKVWADTGGPDGHKVLADGTHLVCETTQHAMLHLTADGQALAPASTESEGQPLRAPNDLTLDTPNAGFYFTDPGGATADHPIGTLHYVDRAGKTHTVDSGLAGPNGLVLSPDGKRLYVGDCQTNRLLVYEVTAPGKLAGRKEFGQLPTKDAAGQVANQPDGMCIDAAGNLYVAHYGMQQVQVFSPEGKLIARYPAGVVTTSNVAFGGPHMDQLFVTGGQGEGGRAAVCRLDLGVKGISSLPPKK